MALVMCLTCRGRGFIVKAGKIKDCPGKCKNGYIDKKLL